MKKTRGRHFDKYVDKIKSLFIISLYYIYISALRFIKQETHFFFMLASSQTTELQNTRETALSQFHPISDPEHYNSLCSTKGQERINILCNYITINEP